MLVVTISGFMLKFETSSATMDSRIVPEYLKKDELSYELRYRGADPSDMTVSDMRGSLRSFLRLESQQTTIVYPKYEFKLEDEVAQLTSSYDNLKVDVDKFSGSKTDPAFKRLSSRLLHIFTRINRLPVNSEDEKLSEERGLWLIKVTVLMDALSRAAKPVAQRTEPSMTYGMHHSTRVDIVSDDSTDDLDHVEDTPTPQTPQSRNGNSTPVYKWNLKFSGDPKRMSVNNFLERVEELRVARHVSEADLFASAIDLFEGKALLWYRSVSARCSDWQELSKLLMLHYLPPDYYTRLFQEILERKQGPTESIVEYLSSMTALFVRYGKVGPDVQLDIISRNLSPFYLMNLPVVESLAELERECLKLEVKKYRAESYPTSFRRHVAAVEPELSCVQGVSGVSPNAPEINAVRSGSVPIFQMTCYNCKKQGHMSRDCREPYNRHCYRCQKPGYTVRTCPNCTQSSGNEVGRC